MGSAGIAATCHLHLRVAHVKSCIKMAAVTCMLLCHYRRQVPLWFLSGRCQLNTLPLQPLRIDLFLVMSCPGLHPPPSPWSTGESTLLGAKMDFLVLIISCHNCHTVASSQRNISLSAGQFPSWKYLAEGGFIFCEGVSCDFVHMICMLQVGKENQLVSSLLFF